MSSGDRNVSFRSIIWTKEIFFWQSDAWCFLTKGELFYKNPFKEVSPQITISESTKSGRKRQVFSHDSHKNNFQFTTEQKID